ncbi:hypothetical protein OROGR_003730 [Orobanche gracilis]
MSVNSDSKSKRSLKSVSPKPSSYSIKSGDGKSSNKKKKTAQNTLGMGRGASSRHAFRISPSTDFVIMPSNFDGSLSGGSHDLGGDVGLEREFVMSPGVFAGTEKGKLDDFGCLLRLRNHPVTHAKEYRRHRIETLGRKRITRSHAIKGQQRLGEHPHDLTLESYSKVEHEGSIANSDTSS